MKSLQKQKNNNSRLKVVAALGNTTFYSSKYNSIHDGKTVPLDVFLKYKVGVDADIKVTFNNCVSSKTSLVIDQKTETWTKLDEKEYISVHLVDKSSKERYTVSLFAKENELQIHKVRAKQVKHIFLNVIKIGVDDVKGCKYDMRIRLDQMDTVEPTEEMLDFVSRSSFDSESKKVTFPTGSTFKTDCVRFKKKTRKREGNIKMSWYQITEESTATHEVLFYNVALNTGLQEIEINKQSIQQGINDILQKVFEIMENIS